jgi:holin-like protein
MTDVIAKPLRPADWVAGFALLILCQLAGETLVQILRLIVPAFAFPGPVIGMLLLVGLLMACWVSCRCSSCPRQSASCSMAN